VPVANEAKLINNAKLMAVIAIRDEVFSPASPLIQPAKCKPPIVKAANKGKAGIKKVQIAIRL
jgi:hypothetical protein